MVHNTLKFTVTEWGNHLQKKNEELTLRKKKLAEHIQLQVNALTPFQLLLSELLI